MERDKEAVADSGADGTSLDPVDEILNHYLSRCLGGDGEDEEELLAAHPEHAGVLRRRLGILKRLGALGPDAARGDAAAGALPERFDDYRITGVLGRGGMGVVYEAEQLSLGRKVAIKVLTETPLLSGVRRERFEREIAALAKVDHPGIVKVFGSGTIDDRAYVVMERLEGEPLDRRLVAQGERPGPEAVRELLTIGCKIARALDHVHERGMIHRDVKPANIFIDRRGEPLLLDFGLARDDARQTMTLSGEFIGTLAYTAPEQALGERVDRRADVFGLGATLYHLLTGSPRFPAASHSDLIRRIDRGDPPSASRSNPSLSRDLCTVLEKATEARPWDRYGSCEDLARDLEAVLDGRPITARPIGIAGRTLRWARRRPAMAALIVVTVVALGLGATIGSDKWEEHRAGREKAYQLKLDRALALINSGAGASAESLLAELCEERPEDPDPLLLRAAVPVLKASGAIARKGSNIDLGGIGKARTLIEEMPPGVKEAPSTRILLWCLNTLEEEAGGLPGRVPEGLLPEIIDPHEAVRVAWTVKRLFGDDRGALELVRPIIDSHADHFPAHILRANLGLKTTDLEAYRSAVSATHLRPDSSYALERLALLTFFRARITEEAAKTFEKLPADPGVLAAVSPSSRSSQMKQEAASDLQLALKLGKRAVDLDPESANAQHTCGYLYAEVKPDGWQQKAEKHYRRSLVLSDSSHTRWNLANLLQGLKRSPLEVIETLGPAGEDYGHQLVYWRNLAISYWKLHGKSKEGSRKAVEILEQGLSQVEESSLCQLNLTIADFYTDLKDEVTPAPRQAAYDRALQLLPEEPSSELLGNCATAALAIGEKRRMEAVLKLCDGHPQANEKLVGIRGALRKGLSELEGGAERSP